MCEVFFLSDKPLFCSVTRKLINVCCLRRPINASFVMLSSLFLFFSETNAEL